MSKFEKLKEHLKTHKELYIGLGVGALIGGVAVYSVVNYGAVINLARAKNLAIAGNNNTVELAETSIKITIESMGNSGNIIKDVTTGTIYPSQNAAAKAIGVGKDVVSKHLNGRLPNANDHILEKIIDGSAPHVLQVV